MAKVVSPISAKVEVVGKLKDGDYGPYRSVLFLDQSQPEGSEAAKIWKSLSDEETKPLRKGVIVQLIPAGSDKNGNVKHNIVLLDTQNTSPPTASASTTPPAIPQRPDAPPLWTDDQKRQLSAAVCDHADLFRFCLETVKGKINDLADHRDHRAIATTVYLQVLRQEPTAAITPENALKSQE